MVVVEASVTFMVFGHRNVRSTHKSTLEFTTDALLTVNGDCILGVKSSLSCQSLPEHVKQALRQVDHDVRLELIVETPRGSLQEVIQGKTHPSLELSHPTDMVIRKSEFICNRTLFIKADKAARDINPKIVKSMQNPHQRMTVSLFITRPK